LTRNFAAQFAAKYHKSLVEISPDAIQALQAFCWPGNVRQLENAIQQAVLVSEGSELTLNDLPEEIRRNALSDPMAPIIVSAPAANGHVNGNGSAHNGSLLQNRAQYERGLIQQTLAACQNNRSAAARALGVSRVTLHKKIKQYGLT
jgi:two-component system response regulator HydG